MSQFQIMKYFIKSVCVGFIRTIGKKKIAKLSYDDLKHYFVDESEKQPL